MKSVRRIALAMAFFLASLLACTVRVYSEEPIAPEFLAETSAMIGTPVEQSDTPHGAVTVDWVEVDGRTCGTVVSRDPCATKVESCRAPLYLAHELGHAHTLGHVCYDPEVSPPKDAKLPLCSEAYEDNLMHPVPRNGDPAPTLDAKQRRRVSIAAGVMSAACRR